MKINEQCLPCLVNQAIKTARLANAENREALYSKIFAQMSRMDFSKTNPEIIGENYRLIKEHVGSADPYREIKSYYNQLFSEQMDTFEQQIHSLEDAVKYAIVANIIDFNPIHGNVQENVQHFFSDMENLSLIVNDVGALRRDVETAKSILYIGDNCGEICFDKLLIRRIKTLNPHCTVYFGVRGEAVVNDSTEEDAYAVGMDECATVISNGDYALGTVLSRVSPAFREVYRNADVVIAKGQANYESLSDENQNIYFLLMVKCKTIAEYIGVPEKSLVCLKSRQG